MTAERHVLVVDDEPDIREIVRTSLSALAGWRVTTAEDGPEAIAAVEAERPDAVLCDVMMPGIDGPEVARRLHALPGGEDLPVLLVTAKAQQAEVRALEGKDVAGVIAKPFDPMTLHERVAELLGWA